MDLAEQQAIVCRALGNSRRQLILWLLSKDELPVNEIAVRAGSTLQNVSQHLAILKKAGIVTSRRAGQTIYYRVADHNCIQHCLVQLQTAEIPK